VPSLAPRYLSVERPTAATWSADTSADINLYSADDGDGACLHVCWYSDRLTAAAVGGVIDVSTAGDVH